MEITESAHHLGFVRSQKGVTDYGNSSVQRSGRYAHILVEQHADECARQFASEKTGSKTQLRRFYQEYVGLRERIRTEEDYSNYSPAVKMMLSKAAYAWRGGRDAKIPRSLYEWLTQNVKAIQSAADVKTFGDYFEAVVGFYYGYGAPSGGNVGGRR